MAFRLLRVRARPRLGLFALGASVSAVAASRPAAVSSDSSHTRVTSSARRADVPGAPHAPSHVGHPLAPLAVRDADHAGRQRTSGSARTAAEETSAAWRAWRTSSGRERARADRALHLDRGDVPGRAHLQLLFGRARGARHERARHRRDGDRQPRVRSRRAQRRPQIRAGRISRSSPPTTSSTTPATRPRHSIGDVLEPFEVFNRGPQGRRHRHGQPLEPHVDLRSAEPPRHHAARHRRGRAVLRRSPAPLRRRRGHAHAPRARGGPAR